LAGDALDRNIGGDKKSEFFAHLGKCGPCRNEYEIELLAKSVVRHTLKHVSTPPAVSQSVVRLVHDQVDSNTRSHFWSRLLSWRFLAPALAASVVILALTSLLIVPRGSSNNEYTHTATNDIIRQSLDNFSLVQSGELKPSMIACYADVIVGYFQRLNVQFAVSIPSDDSCDWYGAIANTYDGVNLAHIVYKRGNDLLYVYEVGKTDALEGSVLSLPPAAKESLVKTGWYTDPHHNDCNVVLWTDKGTLCAAVSTMKKDRLLAFLSPR
jgi:hypothetical protein